MGRHRILGMVLLCAAAWRLSSAAEPSPLTQRVIHLCRDYLEGFGSRDTDLVYHHRLNGPKGLASLASPDQIARGTVGGQHMPYGYGSGIQDVALEGGQFLFALCDAYEATGNAELAEMARRIFRGMRRVATLSPEPGFVPRGPHPDGKSYYRDSSRDQHAALAEALWRYGRCRLASDDDRRLVAEKLAAMAERMERNGWRILVEDNSAVAHVGFTWLQETSIGAVSLLSFLAMVADATGDARWDQRYEELGRQKDGLRWRLLHPNAVERWRNFTLYSNQFAQALAALERAEKNPTRRDQVRRLQQRLARRALESNVFDTQYWRRLDWAGQREDAQIEPILAQFGLSLGRPATVGDLWQAFNIERWLRLDSATKTLYGKLCFGLPTVAFHGALLSGDAELRRRVAPDVARMLDAMLTHGRHYEAGENFNRAAIVGLLLVAAGQ